MKGRLGFISNSSSASFLIIGKRTFDLKKILDKNTNILAVFPQAGFSGSCEDYIVELDSEKKDFLEETFRKTKNPLIRKEDFLNKVLLFKHDIGRRVNDCSDEEDNIILNLNIKDDDRFIIIDDDYQASPNNLERFIQAINHINYHCSGIREYYYEDVLIFDNLENIEKSGILKLNLEVFITQDGKYFIFRNTMDHLGMWQVIGNMGLTIDKKELKELQLPLYPYYNHINEYNISIDFLRNEQEEILTAPENEENE